MGYDWGVIGALFLTDSTPVNLLSNNDLIFIGAHGVAFLGIVI